MNFISNIWNQPRTTAAGLLIAAVSVAGVLAQQGVSLGKVGTGTVVSLISALATALLGLLAKDPETASVQVGVAASQRDCRSASQQAKLGAWAMIALLLPLPWMQGCSERGIAQDIVNWTPSLQSAVVTVDSTAALLAPADAPIFAAATVGFDAATNLLVAQAKDYLANPSAGVLLQLQTAVVTMQQQVDAATLQAARIVDAASQQHALAAIQSVATIVSAILSLVQSISSQAAVTRMASSSTIKLAAVEPYLNRSLSAKIVAAHYAEPVDLARVQLAQAELAQVNAGF